MDSVAFTKRSLTLAAAIKGAEAAFAAAGNLGLRIAIAMVDEGGGLKYFARMDGARPVTVDFAQKKAVTAARTHRPTREYFEYLQQDPQLSLIATNTDLLVLGGGLPITVGDEVVGAIGISGGHYNQDVECAQAAIDAMLALG